MPLMMFEFLEPYIEVFLMIISAGLLICSDTLGVEYIGGVVFAYWLVGLFLASLGLIPRWIHHRNELTENKRVRIILALIIAPMVHFILFWVRIWVIYPWKQRKFTWRGKNGK